MFCLIALILNIQVLCQDECQFKENLIWNVEDVVKCLKTVPYDPKSEEITGIKQSILDVLKSYAYTDQVISLPEDFKDQEADVVSEIEAINPEDYDNYYDYNLDLTKTIFKLKDSHFGYYPPCFGNFGYLLPFNLQLIMDDKNEPKVVASEMIRNSLNLSITSEWLKHNTSNVDLRGKTITKLTLPDLEPASGDESAATTLSRWSQKYSSFRTPLGRQNWAFQHDFCKRAAYFFDVPKDSINVTYLDDNNREQRTVLSFVGLTDKINSSINDICPLQDSSSSSSSSSFTSSVSSLVSDVNSKVKGLKNKKGKNSKILNKINEILNNNNNNNNKINLINDNSINVDSSDPLVQIRKEEIRESYKRLEREGKLKDFKDKNITKQHVLNNHYYPHMFNKAKNAYLQKMASLHKEKNSEGMNNEEYNNSSLPNFLFMNNEEGFSYLIYPDLQLAMLTFPTWMVENVTDFLDLINKAYLLIDKYNCTKLIINKIGNTGGLVVLSDLFVSALFPRQYTPHYTASFPATDANLVCESSHLEQSQPQQYPENKRIKNAEGYQPYRNVTVKGEMGEDNQTITKTREWSRKYYGAYGDIYLQVLYLQYPELEKIIEKRKFTPDNTIILLDGVCVSACAIFSKFVSQKKLAATVMYGNTIYNPDKKVSDIADACSEEVVDLDEVYRRQEEMKSNYSLPSKFKRTTGSIRYPVGAKYSINEGEEDTMMEFNLVEPDYVVNDFIDYENIRDPHFLASLSLYVSSYFDKCLSWQVKTNSSCKGPSEGKKMDHAIYGNPCNASISSYNLDSCVFAGCEDGYYLKDEKCVKLPGLDIDMSEILTLNKGVVALVVVVIVFVLLFVVSLIVNIILTVCLCCYYERKNKRSKKEGGLYEKINDKNNSINNSV